MQAGVSVLGGILGGIFGRKVGMGTLTRSSASIGKATTAYKHHQDVANAEANVSGIATEIAAIEREIDAGVAALDASFDPQSLPIETEAIKPKRTDVKVESVGLLWLPHDSRGVRVW